MISEKYLKNKDEILELCQEWCKLNTHECKEMSLDESIEKMQQIEREIANHIFCHTDKGATTQAIINWYWNTKYLKDTTDSEWLEWWFFNITKLKEGTDE